LQVRGRSASPLGLLAAAAMLASTIAVALPAPALAIQVETVVAGMPGIGDITQGPDGSMWFTCNCGPNGTISRIAPDGSVTRFPATDNPSQGAFPKGIAAGDDGNMWFVSTLGNRISRITPTGRISSFPTGFEGDAPQLGGDIVAGPDGGLWFTGSGGRVGRIDPTGAVRELRPIRSRSAPTSLAAGPDGNVWAIYGSVSSRGGWIVRITPSGGTKTFRTDPRGIGGTQPGDIAAGPDGNMWFTSGNAQDVLRIDRAGAVESMARTFFSPFAGPRAITGGPDGNVWFTSSEGPARIMRITPSGAVSEFRMPAVGRDTIYSLSTGPDKTVWVTTYSRIIRIKTGPITARVSASGAFSLPTVITCGARIADCKVAVSVTGVRERARDHLGGKRFSIYRATRERRWKVFAKRVRATLSRDGRRLLRNRKRLPVRVTMALRSPGGTPARATRSMTVILTPSAR
jgi:streptogramin lyase